MSRPDRTPENSPSPTRFHPPGPEEGFQLLGDDAAGHCVDGVCVLPTAAELTPTEEPN